MNEEIKIGDYVEYKGETYTVMAINTFIAINYNDGIDVVRNNAHNDENRHVLYKQGWKEDDPLYWVDKAELKIVKMLRDFE